MRRLVLSSLRAHTGRLVLTVIAITLSVSFVTAGFVLADSLRSVFDDVSSDIYADVDAQIRAGEGDFDRLESGERFAQADLAAASEIDGVEELVPGLGAEFALFAVDAAGETLRPQGPPVLNFAIAADPTDPQAINPASPFLLVSGGPPGPGEVVLDTAQARELGVVVGDAVTVATPHGTEQFTLAGTVVFGEEEIGVSPYFLLFDLPTMQRLLDEPGRIDGAAIRIADGADPAEVIARVESVLPSTLLVADQAELIGEQQAEFGEGIDLIQSGLLIFAGITTFVAIFVIANTFAVLVGQQTRQLGLLRAVGASSRQAATVVVAEASAVGVLASAFGLGLGLLAAQGIIVLFESVTTGGFPDGPLQLAPRTVAAAVLVGVGVTVVAALVPARRAARVSPMQAMRLDAGGAAGAAERGGRRTASAAVLGLFARPLQRISGASGRLAATNLGRNPRRVLSTAMSMIVGLTLIAGLSVMASSYRATLSDAMRSDFDADLILTGTEGGSVPYAATAALATLPDVEAASGFGRTEVRIGDEIVALSSFQSGTANGVLDLGVVAGSLPGLDETAGDMAGSTAGTAGAVTLDFATDHGLGLGDELAVEFSDGTTVPMTIGAVFDDDSIVTGSVLVDESLVAAHARNVDADLGAVRFRAGVDPTEVQRDVDRVLENFAQIEARTVDEFLAARQAQVDQLLVLAYGLLALTVVIAMSGIANTVALSVLERSHEIGLLRSVGMSRRQVRSMIRYEAVLTAAAGATLGVALGVGIGAVASRLAPAAVIDRLVLPAGQLAVYLVAGTALGLVAAAVPAWRAARRPLV